MPPICCQWQTTGLFTTPYPINNEKGGLVNIHGKGKYHCTKGL